MAIDKFMALGAKAAAEGADQTKVSTGGGDYTPPAAGPTRLRFIAYIETGKQAGTYMGKPTIKEKVTLVFELSGPKHQPLVDDAGVKTPIRITIDENLSLNEKARFTKLFGRMNHAGKAQHMVQLLGEAYKGVVVHRKYAKQGEDRAKPETWTGISAELFDKGTGSYTIEPARYEVVDPETGPTGEYAPLKVDPPISELKGFLWQYADKESWDSLFIEGEYPERKDEKGKVTQPAKSKNVLQNLIKRASNFVGSPLYAVLLEGGANLDIPEAEVPDEAAEEASAAISKAAAVVPQGAAADDALNNIVG